MLAPLSRHLGASTIGIRRATALVGVFVVALGVLAYAVNRNAPMPANFRYRWEAFVERKDQITILFLGSSITMRGVVPDEVEAAMAEHGHGEKVFNLGISQASRLEIDELFRRIVALKPKRLRIVVLEGSPIPVDSVQTDTERFRWWHTTRQTSRALRISRKDIPGHLSAFRYNFLNVGRVVGWKRGGVGRTHIDGWRPYSPRDIETGSTRGRRIFLTTSPGEWAELLASTKSGPACNPMEEFIVAGQTKIAEQAGFSIRYVLPPALANEELPFFSPPDGCLDFSDPEAFPSLFEYEARHDAAHLSELGALRYSRILARDLLPDSAPQATLNGKRAEGQRPS